MISTKKRRRYIKSWYTIYYFIESTLKSQHFQYSPKERLDFALLHGEFWSFAK